VVLTNASLELVRGQTTSLVGVSGSGKSTLLGLIAGLMQPDSGRIVIDGQDITRLDDPGRARLRARRVGVVLQSGNLIPFSPPSRTSNSPSGWPAAAEPPGALGDLLSELGLAGRLHHLPRRLSGGEAQRVAAAVALANQPDLLLADEVTGELDTESAEQVMTVILDAWRERGLTVLFVTHSRELAAQAQRRLRLIDREVRPA
jgi:putative ABC transport system ATP-binding protein